MELKICQNKASGNYISGFFCISFLDIVCFYYLQVNFLCVQRTRVRDNVFQTQISHTAPPPSTQVIGIKTARLIRKTAGVCFRVRLKGMFLP